MKFTEKKVISDINILANDHFVAVPYDCTNLTALSQIMFISGKTELSGSDNVNDEGGN